MKKISIIIPVYNVEKYLERCINSIIHQTYKEIEVILVDDGSTDKSGMICDQAAKRDQRIKVIHVKNQGVSSARNEGLRRASGDYIYFADADDWLEPFMLEKMVQCQQEQNVDLVICGYYVEKENETSVYCMRENQMLDITSLMKKIYIPAEINGVVWNKLFLRKLVYDENNKIRATFQPAYSIWEDVLWVTQICVHVKKAYYISKPYYHYIKRNTSASTRGFHPHKCSMIAAGMAIRNVLIENKVDQTVLSQFDNYMHLHFRGTIYEIYKFSPQYKNYIKDFRNACFQVEKFGLLSRNCKVHNLLMKIHPKLDSNFIAILQKRRSNK